MSNKYLYLIPLLLIEVILQLVFFWLAPDVPCYWAVYAFGSVLTILHIGVTFWVGTSFGIRRSTASIVGGSICQIVLITICGVLLAGGFSVRNAVFSLLIVSMLYIVIETLLILSIENDEDLDSHTGNPFDGGIYYDETDARGVDSNEYKSHNSNCTVHEVSSTPPFISGSMALDSGVIPPPLPTRRE